MRERDDNDIELELERELERDMQMRGFRPSLDPRRAVMDQMDQMDHRR